MLAARGTIAREPTRAIPTTMHGRKQTNTAHCCDRCIALQAYASAIESANADVLIQLGNSVLGVLGVLINGLGLHRPQCLAWA